MGFKECSEPMNGAAAETIIQLIIEDMTQDLEGG